MKQEGITHTRPQISTEARDINPIQPEIPIYQCKFIKNCSLCLGLHIMLLRNLQPN